MGKAKYRRDAQLALFFDPILAHFGESARVVSKSSALIRLKDKLLAVSVNIFSEPSKYQPNRPLIYRIKIGSSICIGGTTGHLIKELGFAEAILEGNACYLELTITPEEMVLASTWLRLWLDNSPAVFQLNGIPSPREGTINFDDREYLWSERAKDLHQSWERTKDPATKVREMPQFDVLAENLLPPTRDPPRQFRLPKLPENWSKGLTEEQCSVVKFSNQIYLRGTIVTERLTLACEDGFIVMPNDWYDSQFWRAWNNTWFDLCKAEHRPFIYFEVWGNHSIKFGRRIVLNCDLIWISKESGFELPASLVRKVEEYLDRLPQALKRWLWNRDGRRASFSTCGYLKLSTEYVEPLQWIMDCFREYSPMED